LELGLTPWVDGHPGRRINLELGLTPWTVIRIGSP
jgi:hypothetical protein